MKQIILLIALTLTGPIAQAKPFAEKITGTFAKNLYEMAYDDEAGTADITAVCYYTILDNEYWLRGCSIPEGYITAPFREKFSDFLLANVKPTTKDGEEYSIGVHIKCDKNQKPDSYSCMLEDLENSSNQNEQAKPIE